MRSNRQQRLESQVKEVGLVLERRRLGVKGLGQCGSCNVAKSLDVEHSPGADVGDSLGELGWATRGVLATKVDVAIARRCEWRTTGRALARHHERALAAVAKLHHGAENLGNHVAGLAEHDGVADQHALSLDDILVMQGCELNG